MVDRPEKFYATMGYTVPPIAGESGMMEYRRSAEGGLEVWNAGVSDMGSNCMRALPLVAGVQSDRG